MAGANDAAEVAGAEADDRRARVRSDDHADLAIAEGAPVSGSTISMT